MSQPEFAAGQAWRFLGAPNAEARLIVGRIEPRGERRVIHASVVDLPSPPEAAELFARMEALRERDPEPAPEPLTQIIQSGMVDSRGDWYWGSWLLDKPTGTTSIPHIVLYENDLREAVMDLAETGRDPSEHFAFEYQLWEEGERRWPGLHDSDLRRPLRDRVSDALRSVPSLLDTFAGEPPP